MNTFILTSLIEDSQNYRKCIPDTFNLYLTMIQFFSERLRVWNEFITMYIDDVYNDPKLRKQIHDKNEMVSLTHISNLEKSNIYTIIYSLYCMGYTISDTKYLLDLIYMGRDIFEFNARYFPE